MRILQAGLRWCQHSPGVKATIKQRDSSVTAVGLCVLWAASKPGSVGISFRSGQECVCVCTSLGAQGQAPQGVSSVWGLGLPS